MSVRASTWAWQVGQELGLGDGEFRVLARLADHADSDGICWPGEKGLAEACVKSERRIRENLARLTERGLISRHRRESKGRGGRRPDLIHLHLEPDESAGSKSQVEPDAADARTGRQQSIEPDAGGARTTTKEPSIEPSEESSRDDDPEAVRLCELLAQRSNERSGRKRPYAVTKTGLDEMRRLIEIDGREPPEVERAIEWIHRDEFWGATCWSPENLRRNYDTMRQQAQRNGNGRRSVGSSGNDLRTMAAQLRAEGK